MFTSTKIKAMFQKLSLIAAFAMMCLLISSTTAFAQNFSPLDKSPADITSFPKRGSDKIVKVVYSRPQVKGRKVFGGIVKYDKVWRTGANEATEITFSKDVKIGGKPVKAGTYTLFTIPTEDTWTVIINSELNQWGAYQYKESNDVIRTEVTSRKSEEIIESFSITFEKSTNGAKMYLGWEKTIVEVPIEF